MRGKGHPDPLRAQVMVSLLLGGGTREIARQYGLPKQTVSDWRKRAKAREFGTVRTKKREDFDALMTAYLHASLKTLIAQAEQFGKTEWLMKQNARSLGLLHGILADRALRILEMMS